MVIVISINLGEVNLGYLYSKRLAAVINIESTAFILLIILIK